MEKNLSWMDLLNNAVSGVVTVETSRLNAKKPVAVATEPISGTRYNEGQPASGFRSLPDAYLIGGAVLAVGLIVVLLVRH